MASSMALRSRMRKKMKAQPMASAEKDKSSITKAKGMGENNLNNMLGIQGSVSMPACKRVKP